MRKIHKPLMQSVPDDPKNSPQLSESTNQKLRFFWYKSCPSFSAKKQQLDTPKIPRSKW